MRGSVRALHELGFVGVKFDSCSMFHNLTRWAELLNATGRAVLTENCHQGGYAPGMRQWQAYAKNATSGEYSRHLGYYVAGSDDEPPLLNSTFDECVSECSARGAKCVGICFESDEPVPRGPIAKCYVKGTGARFAPMDLSNSNHCTGVTSPSDCPYNFFRTSGDIQRHWTAVLANLESTVPFLTGAHPLSRPGAWAYPDMLEVGNLANASESRSHFGAWAIISSPLILSFDLSKSELLDAMWPIITNRAVIAVNQKWAGHPGRRVHSATSSQVWAKPLGNGAHAVFFLSTGPHEEPALAIPYANVSVALANTTLAVCVRDLYTNKEYGPFQPRLQPELRLPWALPPHDSAFLCVRAVSGPRGGDRSAAPGIVCEAAADAGCPPHA